tara:strand:+ start:1344 stop:2822 length:1479 start_codon:yes stop_codon:yes gene_type:complete
MNDIAEKLEQGHYIDGQWLTSNGESFVSENPATDAPLWRGNSAEQAQINEAVTAATRAFPSWSRLSYQQRSEYIAAFIEAVKAHQEKLGETIHLETGKPHWESKTEVAAMIGKAAISEKAYQQRTGSEFSDNAGLRISLNHRAIGVFAVLGPYNFPAHLPNGHIIPALLAGNTLVFKPSELTPLVGELMIKCWIEAGLPRGVLNLLQGGRSTGELLTANEAIDGVLFTGSSKTGAAIHKQFGGKTEKMLALEMGGNNPLVVAKVKNAKAAVYNIVQSAFISAGQRCTCARRLILLRSAENEEILALLKTATQNIKVGVSDDCFIGPVVSNAAAENVMQVAAKTMSLGGSEVLAVQRLDPAKPFIQPGIIDVTDVEKIDDEECFGPLLQVIWVDNLDEAITVANNTRYGLSAGLLSDDENDWNDFYQRIRAGIVNWNRPITGASGAAPFGGVGASGNFRPGAFYAADYSAYPIASMASAEVELPNPQSPGLNI